MSRSGELEFLRAEVANLERIIGEANRSRSDELERRASDRARLEQQLMQAEAQLDQAREQLRALYLEQAATKLAASRHEYAASAAGTQLHLLRTELADTEHSVCALREAEASALSVARTYREFAAQGASRLDELQHGLVGARARLQTRVEELQVASQIALRQRSLRAVLEAQATAAAQAALHRWQRFVAAEQCWDLASARLDTALRREAIAARTKLCDAKVRMDREAEREALELREACRELEAQRAFLARALRDERALDREAPERAALQSDLHALSETAVRTRFYVADAMAMIE